MKERAIKRPPSCWIASRSVLSAAKQVDPLVSPFPPTALLSLTQTQLSSRASPPFRSHRFASTHALPIFPSTAYRTRHGAACSTSFDFAFNLLHRLAKPWIPRSDANLCFNWNRKSSVKARTTGWPNVINRSKHFRSSLLRIAVMQIIPQYNYKHAIVYKYMRL